MRSSLRPSPRLWGEFEVICCGIALVLLLVSTALHPRRRTARRVLWTIAVVFALTVAQAFGLCQTWCAWAATASKYEHGSV